MTILDTVRSAYAAGLCLLPARADGTKAPDASSWSAYQTTRPTVEQMRAWRFATRNGFGMVAGAVSGSRLCWDFDCADTFVAFMAAAEACGLADVVSRIRTGYEDRTPNGGTRWIVQYPADVTFTDRTLARRPGHTGEPAVKTLIEFPTFSILAPSNGATHPSGRPYVRVSGDFSTIAAVSGDEVEALTALARSFDQMPRREYVPPKPKSRTTSDELKPGEDFNARAEWTDILPDWTEVYTRGETIYLRRPGKDVGVSATINALGTDRLHVFTSSTVFEPDTSYSKFGAYTVLHHGGDFRKAALALSKDGYGAPAVTDEDVVVDAPRPPVTPVTPITPCALDDTIAVFRRWLSLDDPSAVYAVAATLVANRAPGDPVWLLLVCAPSTGKTEILSAATRLPWVLSAAKVTEASLLSGSSRRDRKKDSTGGLLRQIGEFGVLLCKDFTSVLAQNHDARGEAMAALREVYDGSWDRPVGTDGGKVLSWRGKCGLIGGVTPALDQYGQVLTSLGDRFVLLRMPDVDVDEFGAAALRHGEQEHQMRHELREALAGLVDHAEVSRVNRTLTHDEQQGLIRLAAYAARSRTAVVRDGYRQDVLYLPQVEGPGRLVKAFARLLGGLEAIGCAPQVAWNTVTRVALDCAPALRTKVIRALLAHMAPARTSDIAAATACVTKTASRYLEDLSILNLADHTKHSSADNAPDLWQATDWLRQYWPLQSETDKYPLAHNTLLRGRLAAAPDGASAPPSQSSVGFSPTSAGEPGGVMADDGPLPPVSADWRHNPPAPTAPTAPTGLGETSTVATTGTQSARSSQSTQAGESPERARGGARSSRPKFRRSRHDERVQTTHRGAASRAQDRRYVADHQPPGVAAFADWQRRHITVPPVVDEESYATSLHETGHILSGACTGEAPHYRDPQVQDWHCCVACEVAAWRVAMRLARPAWTRVMHARLTRSLVRYRRKTPAWKEALHDLDATASTLAYCVEKQRRLERSPDMLLERLRESLESPEERLDREIRHQRAWRASMRRERDVRAAMFARQRQHTIARYKQRTQVMKQRSGYEVADLHRDMTPDMVEALEKMEALKDAFYPCDRCHHRRATVVHGTPSMKALCESCAADETIDREVRRQREEYAAMKARRSSTNT